MLKLIKFREISRHDVFEWVGHDLGPNDFRHRIALGTVLSASFKLTDLDQVVKSGAFNAPEDCMFLVKPWAGIECHKELGLVRIRDALISHGKDTAMAEFESLMKLVLKGHTAIYGLASSASPRWVATLDHEAFDYPVKDRTIIISF